MPLPDLIEIIPWSHSVHARITVPGSKSITNRALILAALSGGETLLLGALWSEDTQVMVAGLQRLGFQVQVEPDPAEVSNRTIRVRGLGGHIPEGGTPEKPLPVFVGNAGTAARFLTALVCLGHWVYRLEGIARMHQRPQAALFKALRQLGYQVDTANDRLPATVHGTGPRPGTCQVDVGESSQFASALLLCAGIGGWTVQVQGYSDEESPYIELTRQLLAQFPAQGGAFQVEPDASSGSYFVAANYLARAMGSSPAWPPRFQSADAPADANSPGVEVVGWPNLGGQIDAAFPKFLPLPQVISRARDLGDSIMTAIVLAPLAQAPVRFTDLGRLRLQECERVTALRTELTRCGAKVIEEGDTLTVYPSTIHGAEIETYDDHRMAMCFAILGLKVPRVRIKNPACVKKTFPNFFQKLAALPPDGLGVAILDARTGRRLPLEGLFAD